MLETIVDHNVRVRVLNVHIWGTNVHVWVLKSTEYILIFSLLTKIGLDSFFWHPLHKIYQSNKIGYVQTSLSNTIKLKLLTKLLF